ncbi:SGNH/GDSL hydrolase family protein [Bifidobacterium sp. SO1]|uniref:SGNH/GDSL hydrolase family protein n=1 Tax=Bifidobacterium sp. SO1 TaxID=2809029 RepID=UPI001BDC1351|nr:SGNH/GDSL hydrolase family protein [Bifidobacterium sp. SO1]MBT1160447.1 SGNH/GDSL hydrolase family protein [Bifidobacterium sp. SO1]
MSKTMKVLLLGDSITEGIGSKKVNYSDELCRLLDAKFCCDAEIINFAKTGSTICYPIDHIEQIHAIKPDYVIVMYGNVDVKKMYDLTKNRYGLVSLTPSRYKNIGSMLFPRPFISKKYPRKVFDYFDDIYRRIWRFIIERTQGKSQIMTLEAFSVKYKELLSSLSGYKVIACSTVFLDSDIYGGENITNFIEANSIIKRTTETFNNIVYCDIFSELENSVKHLGWQRVYYRDHFHPNIGGYQIISQQIADLFID